MNFVKPEAADISAFSPLKRIGNDAVRWTDGFWHDRRLAVRDQGVQSLLEALDDPENGTYFPNFRHSAQGVGTHRGKEWSDGDCYKVVETMILIYDTDGGEDLDAKIDDMMPTQDHTPIQRPALVRRRQERSSGAVHPAHAGMFCWPKPFRSQCSN